MINMLGHVLVSIDPKYRDLAVERGYDVEPFEAHLLGHDQPFMFWHIVKPTTGQHCAPISLPPMFNLTPIN